MTCKEYWEAQWHIDGLELQTKRQSEIITKLEVSRKDLKANIDALKEELKCASGQ